MNKRGVKGLGALVGTGTGERVTAILAVVTMLSGLAVAHANTSPRLETPVSRAIPLRWSGRAPSPWPCWIKPFPAAGVAEGPPIQTAPRPTLSPARIQYLKRQERLLRRQMWRLRLRRRTFLAEGRPQHAHKVSKRILSLGWRLRQIQAAERTSTQD